MEHYVGGQQARDDRRALAARDEFKACLATCPSALTHDCYEWLRQAEPLVPTLIVRARRGGTEVAPSRVTIDGVVRTEALDGRPWEVEVGPHDLVVDAAGTTRSERVVMSAGSNRVVSIEFPSTAPTRVQNPEVPPRSTLDTPLAIGLGVTGGLAIATFAILGATTAANVNDCGPDPGCSRTDLDSFQTRFVVADIFLLAGLAFGGGAAYFALR